MSNRFPGLVLGQRFQARVVAGRHGWGPGGRELYYISGSKMMVVTVGREPGLHAGRPRAVFESALAQSTRQFDISPGGKRFLMVTPRTTAVPLDVRLILNWEEELERLAPHPRR